MVAEGRPLEQRVKNSVSDWVTLMDMRHSLPFEFVIKEGKNLRGLHRMTPQCLECPPGTKSLAGLRAVSRSVHVILEEYFAHCQHIVVTEEDGKATPAMFEILTRNNAALKSLVIHNMGEWIDDDQLVPVISDCQNLSAIDLSMCKNLTNRSLCMLGMYCNKLTCVTLKGCEWVDQDNFMVLISNNRSLRLVDLENCVQLDDKCIEFMARSCPELESLNLSQISNLTDCSLDAIAKNCSRLKDLNVISCWRMTDHGIRMIKEYSKDLGTLKCEHCRDISEDTLGALRLRGVSVDIQGRLEVTLRRLNHVIDYLSPLVRQLNHNV